ncbi:hypothetical protein [Dehalococcoides mccartyi]|nr:hypothetical protein [Dehalococcoides mccartyi]
MKDKWYGDKRDLVKWGVLLTLAKMFSARRILQVAITGLICQKNFSSLR